MTVVPVWSPCTMTTGAIVTTVTFLTVWTLVIEAIPATMSCQYTSHRNMDTLCCYDGSNGIYLTTILEHFAYIRISCTNFSHVKSVEAHMSIIGSSGVIIAIATETFSYSTDSW